VREAIGLPEVLFQSITHIAPAAVAFSIIVLVNFAAGALPLGRLGQLGREYLAGRG
jgi:hypothetical protein